MPNQVKSVVADLRAEAVAPVCRAPVSSTVTQAASAVPPAARHGFRRESVLAVDQQPHHLAFGDDDAEGAQLRDQPLHGHLPLVILGEHEAAQFRAEMSVTPAGNGASTVLPSGVRQRSRR